MAKRLAGAMGKSSLDMAMAGLAAASVGFVLFAMPDPLFADLVAASGLAALLPAAQPPLGTTARLLSVVAAAIGTFLLVSLALRALGQSSSAPKQVAVKSEPEPEAPTLGRRRSFGVREEEKEEEAPRIRRADAHPDAPARRPLFAGSDLGEPLDEIDVSEVEQEWVDDYGADQPTEPLPAFIADEPSDEAPVFGEYGWESEAEDQPVAADEVDETEAEAAPADYEPKPYEPPVFEPQPYQPEAFAEPEEFSDEPEAPGAPIAFEDPIEDEDEVQPLAAEPAAAAPAPREHGEATIAELMQRLERGLQRRGVAWEAPSETPASQVEAPRAEMEEPSASNDPIAVDDRLRSALDDLQKMASRGQG